MGNGLGGTSFRLIWKSCEVRFPYVPSMKKVGMFGFISLHHPEVGIVPEKAGTDVSPQKLMSRPKALATCILHPAAELAYLAVVHPVPAFASGLVG